MTLDELREALISFAHLPGDTPVVLAKDSEGNEYSPLHELEDATYLKELPWAGERYDKGDAPDNAVPAVFLWPMD